MVIELEQLNLIELWFVFQTPIIVRNAKCWLWGDGPQLGGSKENNVLCSVFLIFYHPIKSTLKSMKKAKKFSKSTKKKLKINKKGQKHPSKSLKINQKKPLKNFQNFVNL